MTEGKADTGIQKKKKKLTVTRHFSGKKIHTFLKPFRISVAKRGCLHPLLVLLNDLWKIRGYLQFSFLIPIDCEQSLFCSGIRGEERESRARAAKPRVKRAPEGERLPTLLAACARLASRISCSLSLLRSSPRILGQKRDCSQSMIPIAPAKIFFSSIAIRCAKISQYLEAPSLTIIQRTVLSVQNR